MALLTGRADSNLSLQQTGDNFTATLSFLPPFSLTPLVQLVLPLTLKMTPLPDQHLFSHGRGGARIPLPLELQPSHITPQPPLCQGTPGLNFPSPLVTAQPCMSLTQRTFPPCFSCMSKTRKTVTTRNDSLLTCFLFSTSIHIPPSSHSAICQKSWCSECLGAKGFLVQAQVALCPSLPRARQPDQGKSHSGLN